MENREYITDTVVSAFLSNILNKYNNILQVKLYGSRAKGNYKPNSDYDLAVFFNVNKNNPETYYSNIIHEIKDELENSNIPYLFDIRAYHEISNIALKNHIDQVGIVIFERTPNIKLDNIPKRHHYIPQVYLSIWQSKEDKSKLWYFDKLVPPNQNDKVKLISYKSTAYGLSKDKSNIYKFTGLNELDFEIVTTQLREQIPPYKIKTCYEKLYAVLKTANNILYIYHNNYCNISSSIAFLLKECIAMFPNEISNNSYYLLKLEESIKTKTPLKIDDSFKQTIAKLAYTIFETYFFKQSEDTIYNTFLKIENNRFIVDNEDYDNLIFFIVQQFFRTKKARNISSKTVKDSNFDQQRPVPHIRINDQDQFALLNLILQTIIKTQEIISKKLLIIILKNTTSISFLTSDQPCYNLDGADCQITGKLSMYYPISPNTAVLVTNNIEYAQYNTQIKELTEQEVNFYNKFILDNAEQYVYANNKQDLEKLITK